MAGISAEVGTVSKWKVIETAPALLPVMVYGIDRGQFGVAKYTHENGWLARVPRGWERCAPPKFWMPLPERPGPRASNQERS